MIGAVSTYFIVLPPKVALTASESSSGISSLMPNGYATGQVVAVNVSCEKVGVGNYVGFRSTEAVIVTGAGINYFIVDESDIIYREPEIITPP